MSDITCPFDDDFCQRKQDRLNEFHGLVVRDPDTNVNFRSTMDMFWDCPIKHAQDRAEMCERYTRYCHTVDKVMDNVIQCISQLIADKTISVDYELLRKNLKQR